MSALEEPGLEHLFTCVSGVGAMSFNKPLLSLLQKPILFSWALVRAGEHLQFGDRDTGEVLKTKYQLPFGKLRLHL